MNVLIRCTASLAMLSGAVCAAPDTIMGDTAMGEGKDIYVEATIVPWTEMQNRDGVISVIPPRHGVQVGGDSAAGLLTEKQPIEIGDVNQAKESPSFRLSY